MRVAEPASTLVDALVARRRGLMRTWTPPFELTMMSGSHPGEGLTVSSTIARHLRELSHALDLVEGPRDVGIA